MFLHVCVFYVFVCMWLCCYCYPLIGSSVFVFMCVCPLLVLHFPWCVMKTCLFVLLLVCVPACWCSCLFVFLLVCVFLLTSYFYLLKTHSTHFRVFVLCKWFSPHIQTRAHRYSERSADNTWGFTQCRSHKTVLLSLGQCCKSYCNTCQVIFFLFDIANNVSMIGSRCSMAFTRASSNQSTKVACQIGTTQIKKADNISCCQLFHTKTE